MLWARGDAHRKPSQRLVRLLFLASNDSKEAAAAGSRAHPVRVPDVGHQGRAPAAHPGLLDTGVARLADERLAPLSLLLKNLMDGPLLALLLCLVLRSAISRLPLCLRWMCSGRLPFDLWRRSKPNSPSQLQPRNMPRLTRLNPDRFKRKSPKTFPRQRCGTTVALYPQRHLESHTC